MQLRRILVGGGLAVVWGILVFAATQFRHLRILDDHSICGPWGCGPPTPDLIAMHAVWLALLGPPLLYLPRQLGFPLKVIRWVGPTLIAIGLAGILSIVAWQWLVWLPQAGAWSEQYIWQRCLFSVVTTIDWPVFHLLLFGSIQWIVSQRLMLRHRIAEEGVVLNG